jgi:GT2 family glycosyltransferase
MATNTKIKPTISICIANYNGEHLLTDCIQSVINQSFQKTIEIIIHDDASEDQSVNLIKCQFPQIILIESASNVGFCISNNRMVEKASGLYILLLNNDATLHKNALQTLFNYSEQQSVKGILGLPQYDMQTRELIDRGMLLDPFLTPIANLDKNISDVGLVIGACFWLPKSLWVTLGGFPEWFVTLGEDLYLCCLARMQGYPVKVLNKSGFNHILGGSLGGGKVKLNKLSTTIKRRQLSEQNRTFTLFICYPFVALCVIFPLHLLELIVEGLTLSLLKHDIAYWNKIYWHTFKALCFNGSRLLKTRKFMQKKRTSSFKHFFQGHTWHIQKIKMFLKFGLPEIN